MSRLVFRTIANQWDTLKALGMAHRPSEQANSIAVAAKA